MKRKSGGLTFFAAAVLVLIGAGDLRSAWFNRGDVDGSGALDLTDPVAVLAHLYLGDTGSIRCRDAADADDSGVLDLTDAVYLLEHLFLGGPRPGPTDLFAGCWFDGSDDDLDCEASAACQPMGAFFCGDRSPSPTPISFDWMKGEITRGVSQLSSGDRFGVAFYDSAIVWFPTTEEPAEATPETVATAIEIIETIQTGHGTCPKPALIRAITWAEGSGQGPKVIVLISDGRATCGGTDEATYQKQTLEEIAARNVSGTPIRTIDLDPVGGNPAWLKLIAERTGGAYAPAPVGN